MMGSELPGHASTELSMTGDGERYCGVPVWELDVREYGRLF